MHRIRVATAVAVLFIPSLAFATPNQVMTFSGIPGGAPGNDIWVEDGITASGGEISWFTTPDAAHLDRLGTPFDSQIEFSTGGIFNAVSIDVRPLSSGYCSTGDAHLGFIPDECSASSFDDPIDYIAVTGSLNGVSVAELSLYRPSSTAFETLSLASFTGIDKLRVEVRTYVDYGLTGACDDNLGCGHIDIDNVVVQAVPEPTAALLFGAGLGIAAMATRRRRLDAPDQRVT